MNSSAQQDQSPIVIIGSGLAGYMLAKEFRKLDKQTPLQIITASDGRFYSKPQLSTALTETKTADTLAIADAAAMSEQLNAVIRTRTKVTRIDPEQQLITFENETLTYSRLVLALGADVIKPPLRGNATEMIFSINDLEDYGRFRKTIQGKKHFAILGAGLVGCEFANDLSNVGHQVEIIAPANYPLDTLLPEAIGEVLQTAFAEKGIQWHLGRLTTEIDHIDGKYKIVLSSGEQLVVDAVLSAIGLHPHTVLAEKAGIKVNRGILVDRELQTSAKNIYALGDCAEVQGLVMLFVAPLLNCARALAKTLAGEITAVHYPSMPIIIKTPACPIAVIPPPKSLVGDWQVTGSGKDLKALFYDQQRNLRGFALTGKATSEKVTLAKQLPPVF